MKLTVTKRAAMKKSDTKAMRREGNIPAVLYSPGKESESLLINGTEFGTFLRNLKTGGLPTTVFTLMMGNKEKKAVVKDIQYELTSYRVSHLDFEELVDNVPVRVKVPVTVTGVVDCIGVKLGGFLRQVVRYVEVECLPKKIPTEFLVDVKDLGIAQTRRLKDVALPEGIRLLAGIEEVLVVVAKR